VATLIYLSTNKDVGERGPLNVVGR
jgi:hypothetical protein